MKELQQTKIMIHQHYLMKQILKQLSGGSASSPDGGGQQCRGGGVEERVSWVEKEVLKVREGQGEMKEMLARENTREAVMEWRP